MSNQSNGPESSENIEVIRELLRKLEEVAVSDSERVASAPRRNVFPEIQLLPYSQISPIAEIIPDVPAPEPSNDLATLQRSMGVARIPAAPMPEISAIPSGPLQIDLRSNTALETVSAPARQARPGAIAALSFAFGIATAIGVIFAFTPAKQILSPDKTAQSGVKVESATANADARTTVADATSVPPAASASIVQPTEKARASAPSTSVKPLTYFINLPSHVETRPGERRLLGLKMEPMPDEAASMLVVVRNLPAWLTLSKGSALGNEIWLLPAHLASDLEIDVAASAEGAANLLIQLATFDGRIVIEASSTVVATRPLQAPSAVPMTARSGDLGEQTLLRLVTRSELLIDTGEVAAARTLLRTAAEAGSVAAALKLAETYDPAEVQRLGMTDKSADPNEAARWYERAEALGSQVASARLVALGRR